MVVIMDNYLERAAEKVLAQITHSQEKLQPLYLQPDRAVFLAGNIHIVLKVYVEGDILEHEYAVSQKIQEAGVPIQNLCGLNVTSILYWR